MKRDRFDDILHSKLQDPEAGYAVPSWNEMERRLVLSENAAGVVRKRSLGRSVKYSIAAAIALLIGFGVYQFGRHSGEMVASLQEGTVSKGGSLPALEQAMKADMIANTEPLNDPALEKLFRSVRSVTPVQPTQSAQNPLHRAMVSAGLNVPQEPSAWPEPTVLSPDEIEGPDRTDEPYLAQGPQTSDQLPFTRSQTDGVDRKASYRNGFDWNSGLKPQRRSWMVSAYTSAHASGASDVKLLRSQTAFNAALVESNYTKNAVTFIGRNLKHRFPISVGVNVKKRLTDRWGIETGLVYSYLESSGDLDAEYTYRYKQKIHYLGIPLNLSYSLYQNKRLDIYLQGGGMAEMALSAHGYTRIFNHGVFASDIDDKLPASGVLWSVGLGAGISYDFVQNFGLYLEPGANYYFPNSNQPRSYRTDNPWSFNVRVGFRFKF